MKNIQRRFIYFLFNHRLIDKDVLSSILRHKIYSGKTQLEQFLMYFLLALGGCSLVAGIVFFFAFNWDALHRFLKIGIVMLSIVIAMCLALMLHKRPLLRQVALSAAAILVGALFAVFGQVYQTGADAYDFFLAWTIFISLLVWASNFGPLWLFYIGLINITIYLYYDQVIGIGYPPIHFTPLFLVNVFFLLAGILLKEKLHKTWVDNWALYLLGILVTYLGTTGAIVFVMEQFKVELLILFIAVTCVYALGLWYGFTRKNIVYLTMISLSLILIVAAWIIKGSSSAGMFLLVAILVVGAVTFTIVKLMELRKKWLHEGETGD
jgi:uncharacterized membrane protein